MHEASMQTCSQSASNTDSLFPPAPPVLATGTKCSHKWHSTWDATYPPGTYSSTSCAPCPSTQGSADLYSPGTSFSNSLCSLARTAGESQAGYLAVPLGAAGNGASASAAASAGWLLASALAAPGSWTLTCRGPMSMCVLRELHATALACSGRLCIPGIAATHAPSQNMPVMSGGLQDEACIVDAEAQGIGSILSASV